MEMIMAVMAVIWDQAGTLPALLWHWELHLLGGTKKPANDPSSVFPSAVIVGCETY